jgi:heptosyltransferase-3
MRRGQPKNRLFDFWLGIPVLNFLAAFHRRRNPPAKIERIGVMCSPALGDTLLFSGPLQDIRAAFPLAHITHICMKPNLAAAEIIPGADARLLIDLTSPLKTVQALRSQHFDVLFDFSTWQRLTALYTLLSGAKFTVGFRTAGQHRSRGYDRLADHTRDRHELENYRAILPASGLIPSINTPHEPHVVIHESTTTPLESESEMIVFHLWASGARSELREWPDANWLALAQRLATPNTTFVLTGAPSDRTRIDSFAQQLNATGLRVMPYVSPDGFLSLTRLLRRAKVVISVNTGVMHLAAIAGAPTVSLNGPTAEHRWGARGRCVANVQPADGSGGYLHLGFEFANQPADIIHRITVDQVFEACTSLIARCGKQEPR